MDRDRAVAVARELADNGTSKAAPADAPIYAELMTLPEYENLEREGHDYVTNAQRKLWVVTVHAPISFPAGMGVKTYQVYTDVIDAETGESFHICTCDVVKGS